MYKSKRKSKRKSRQKSKRKRSWKKNAPRLRSQRKKLYKRCGRKCFLDAENLKFPICSKYARKCTISNIGLLSAYKRAMQYKYYDIAEKAIKLGRKHGFHWAF